MARILYLLGRFASRRRWAILAIWLIALGGLGGTALAVHGTMGDSFTIPGTSAQQAMDELAEKIPYAAGANGNIVFAAPQGQTLQTPDRQQAIGEMLAASMQLDSVNRVIPPDVSGAVSPDGRVAMAQILFEGQITEVPKDTQADLADLAEQYAVDGMTIDLSGAAIAQMPAIGSMEGLGVIVAMVVLLITFGSLLAAGLPLLTAVVGVGVGMAGIMITSSFVEMSSTAPILALMLGLAVGIDYALFIVSRHRSQLRDGMDVQESIGRAVGTAGSAVVFAGLTVMIALAALSVVGIPFLSVMGIAAAVTVAMAVLIAITLVPAILGFAGHKIMRRKNRPTDGDGVMVDTPQRAAANGFAVDAPGTQSSTGSATVAEPRQPRTNRWALFVTRRPIAVLVAGVLLLGIIAIPAFSLRLGLPDDGTAAPDTTQRQAYDLITDSFGPGANGPLIVTIQPNDPSRLNQAMFGIMRGLESLDGVVAVQPAGASDDGTMGMVQIVPATGPSDAATEDLVHQLRDLADTAGERLDAKLAVTGLTAMQIDVSEKLADALPIYLVIVVGLALVLLLIVFRSLLVPLKAAVGFLLTIAVSFGLVVAVYQWGWLGSIFGVHTPAPIISFLPILLVGVLFGLAMDYEVFLVSGMREAWAHSRQQQADAKQAVRGGFSLGSRVVTAAAIIMASVFGGFIMAPDTIIASIGFALALGVLVDAFVVRMTLVPAVMALVGTHAWYLPKWLDKVLPNVDIEGASLGEPQQAKETQLV